MNVPPRLRELIRYCLRGARTLRSRLRLGIAGRLAVGFLGVTVLAAVANLIVKQGVSIVTTTEIRHPTAVAATTAAPPAAPKAALAAPLELETPRPKVRADSLLAALDQLNLAVRNRVASASADTVDQYHLAGAAVARASSEFSTALLKAATSSSRINADIKTYLSDADTLAASANQRRALQSDYADRAEAMDAAIKSSLDHAWTIFGRVLARQSVLQIRSALDEIRRQFLELNSAEESFDTRLEQLKQSEQAFGDALEKKQRDLLNAQGAPWVATMKADLTHLQSTSDALAQLQHQLRDQQSALSQELATLTKAIRDKASIASQPPKSKPPLPADSTVAPAMTAVAPSPTVAEVETRSVTMDDHALSSHRAVIAWISAVVLVILIYMSVGTVLSVVRPVRRLVSASQRLARGESVEPIPRGGLRELDTLADAFNSMSTELTTARLVARDHQSSLERQVDERTRQLQQIAEHDPLTGLPNRRRLFASLADGIERARAAQGRLGLFFLDIDNFKNINDSMGHNFGDRVLLSIARRLEQTCAPWGFAARLGGDEFTILYQGASELSDVIAMGAILARAFEVPLSVDGRELMASASIGASVYPDHAQDAESLLSAADAALFRAKALGRSQLAMFTPELLADAAAKFGTEQGLRRAIERAEFELVFQPEIHTETLDIGLVEALIRWRLPDGRFLSPGEFLAVAEESGLASEINDWVLRTAIEAAATWHHGPWPEARVAINVSPRQLMERSFVERVSALLTQHNLPPHCIEIELTENVLQTRASTIDSLRALRAMGVAIALDDFGTGYSTFASLEQLPLTRVKLDRSLIADIDYNPRSAAIARAIIALCQGLGLEITAEGVERREQFALLLQHGAMYLQGHLLSYPHSREELIGQLPQLRQRLQELLLTLPSQARSDTVWMPLLPEALAQ